MLGCLKKKLKSRIVGTAFSVNSAVYELSRLIIRKYSKQIGINTRYVDQSLQLKNVILYFPVAGSGGVSFSKIALR